MKKPFYLVLTIAAFMIGLSNNSFGQEKGVKVETKKSSAEANKKNLDIKGSKGREMKIDKSGLKIQGKKGGKLEITGKKK